MLSLFRSLRPIRGQAGCLALALFGTWALPSAAEAQIISSAADNDMHPRFSDDGWVNVTGSYDVVVNPGGFSGHAWLEPPDGNTYGGGVQYSGVPGTAEAIQKPISGLTPGVDYVVEWYIMSDRPQGSSEEDCWFEVTFCGVTVDTLHIPWTRRREWIQEVRRFTATDTSCPLNFRARNPSGNNSNWIFLDSVQVAVATSTDFGITVSGPAFFQRAGSTHPVTVTVTNGGPDLGSPPVVTYPLPAGVSVLGGAAGSLVVSGADGAAWSCVANDAAPQTVTCTRSAPIPLGGGGSTFSFNVDFAAAAGGTSIGSALTVRPTFQVGNADPVRANDTARFTTVAVRAICGDGVVEEAEMCDDGNAIARDGCSDTCMAEEGFTCEMPDAPCVAICGDGRIRGAEECDDTNLTVGDGCNDICMIETGWACVNEPSECDAAACGDGIVAGSETCDDGNAASLDGCSDVCLMESGWTCGGAPSTCEAGACGDGILAGVEGCDDGNTDDDDGCSAACAVEDGWSCDDSPSTCEAAACGDGLVVAGEGCDDGNATDGDGCSSGCAVEDGWSCDDAPSTCGAAACGDAVVIAGESCDDGNTVDGDGCDATCAIEHGFECGPSGCASVCGDGAVASDEACDDGNEDGADGCDATCALEPGYACGDNEPSECAAVCGAGLELDEETGECVTPWRVLGGGCSAGSSMPDGLPFLLLVFGAAGLVRARRRRG